MHSKWIGQRNAAVAFTAHLELHGAAGIFGVFHKSGGARRSGCSGAFSHLSQNSALVRPVGPDGGVELSNGFWAAHLHCPSLI